MPVYRTLTADLETPVSAFLRLAADEPECFLLESVEGGEKVGRYTFIGIPAVSQDGARADRSPSGITATARHTRLKGDIFALLKERWPATRPRLSRACRRLPLAPSASSPTTSSARSRSCPPWPKTTSACPDACLMFFDEVLAFDHVKKESSSS